MSTRAMCTLALITLSLFLPAARATFDHCGVLKASGSCIVFEPEGGSAVYAIDYSARFSVGDRVRVIGNLEATCAAPCTVAGCVTVGEITFCEGAVTLRGTLVQSTGCLLLDEEHGLLLRLENTAGFGEGQLVIVSGNFGRRCEPVCAGIRACVLANTITLAPSPPPTGGDGGTSGSNGDTPTTNGDQGGSNPTGSGSGSSGTGGSGSTGGNTSNTGGGNQTGGTGQTNGGGDTTPSEPALEEVTGAFVCPIAGFAALTLGIVGLLIARSKRQPLD